MYTIKADSGILYDPLQNGYALESAKLTLEANKSAVLEITVPVLNPAYSRLKRLTDFIYAYQDGEEIFRGRILHQESNFLLEKELYCEGELGFLQDSIQRPYNFKGGVKELFTQYINNHNEQVEKSKQFAVGRVTVTDSNDTIVRSNENYATTYTEMTDKLTGNENTAGYIVPRLSGDTRYLDYLKEFERTSQQIIEFGSNLLDLTESITANDVYTVLIPVGAEGLTIKKANDGKDYVESQDGISLFGRIVKTKQYDDIYIASKLLAAAKKDVENGYLNSLSLTVTAANLHLLNANTDDIKLGDKVKVVSAPHGINEYFNCNKIVYNFLNPSQTEYTFGYTGNTLTGNGGVDKSIKQLLANAQQAASGAAGTAENAQAIANKAQETASTAQETAQEAQRVAENAVRDAVQKVYPVGSVYCATNNINPAENLGGTWELFDTVTTNGNLIFYAWSRKE